MALFRAHSKLCFDSKPRRAGLEAMGLWLLCGTLSVRNGTPGKVTRSQVRELTRNSSLVSHLVDAGLWVAEADGWSFTGDGEFWCDVERYRTPIPRSLRESVYARDGYACVACSSPDDLTLDHIYPWSLGGPDTEDNLQTLCRSCNSSKGASVAL